MKHKVNKLKYMLSILSIVKIITFEDMKMKNS